MDGTWKCTIVVLLLQSVILQVVAITRGRYVKREEKGTQSRLRFTSGSYGFYNASVKESHTSTWSTIEYDMKMGIYVYDAQTQIDYEVDDSKRFSVRSQKIEDFVFLRVMPNGILNSNIQSVYTINVIARNNRTKELIDTTKIYLHVLDINEFKPKFPNRSIEISVKENLKIGSTVLKVHASDADSGLNGEVFYFIPPKGILQVEEFSLNFHTGALSLIKPLDFIRKSSYVFHIVAKDKCPYDKLRQQSDPLPVKINIIDVSDYPVSGRRRGKREEKFTDHKLESLKFTENIYYSSIAEISPPFTPVARVEMKTNVLPNVVFGFNKGNEEGCFQINSRTGQIYTVKGLDFETTKVYNLTVIAYPRNQIKTTFVVIKVLDSNDHSPTFQNFQDSIVVSEETALGTVVYSARASDSDTGLNSKIFYSIGNMKSTYFDIDQFTGDVRVVKRLDRDSQQSVPPNFYLLIKASDFGMPVKREGRMVLKVQVNRINDNPPVLPFFSCNIRVAANTKFGTKVLKFRALDLDKTSSLIAYNISGNSFKIGRYTGDLKLNIIPSAGRRTRISVMAFDGKLVSTKINLTVFFVSRTIHKKVNVTCLKNPEYSRVEEIIAERSSREKSLDVETFNPIVLPQRKIHKPIFLEKPDSIIYLKEDLPVGSFVTTVLAVDRELKCYGLVLYSIVSGNNDMDKNFHIDMLNGTVYLTGTIDREKTPSYSLRIRAWDTDSPAQYADVDVQIQLIDVNDNSPVFTQNNYHVTVSERTQPGTNILQVKAKDSDRGRNGEVIYSMVSDLEAVFILNKYTGILKLNNVLDYEKQNQYFILIQASDGSSQDQKISQTTIEVTVTDVNDTPPKCLPAIQTVEITRDFPAGAVLGKVYAYDTDTGKGGQIRYEIARGKWQRLFDIDKAHGIIRTNMYTTGELQKDLVYNLSVVVQDLGAPSFYTTCYFVCKLKQSVSLERPRFLRSENPIIVDIKNQDQIIPIEAVLEGSGQLQYEIVDGTGIGDFQVDSKTGQISRTKNREKAAVSQMHYWLTLNAHLKDNPEIYSNVAILLRETVKVEKAPYFDPTVYRVAVRENLHQVTDVLQLSTVNPNSDIVASDLVFKIIDGNSFRHFEVTSNGMLRTTISLDREVHETYHLNVSVSKRNMPQRLSFASVLVSVEDANDNTPEIQGLGMSISLWEQNAVSGNGTFVAQVVAFDKDIGSNAELTFEILEGAEKFQMNSKGVVTSKAKLEALEIYLITFKVSDKGNPSRSAGGFMEVEIRRNSRKGSGSLKFKKRSFTYKIRESIQRILEEQHIEMLPNLIESSRGEFLRFSIQSGNDENKFCVSKVGELNQISELDYETKAEHVLVIKVTDGHKSDSAAFKIIVEDLNDNAPKTSQSCYQAEAMENERAGKVIAQFEALDPDGISKGKLAYKLIGVSPHIVNWNSFSVNELSGKISTIHSFDREKQSKYILTLHVEDHTQTSVSGLRTTYCVAVDIKDANDHKPRFTKSVYTTQVFSPIPAGVPIWRLLAVDHDIGTNALLKFAITGGNSGGHFSIDSVTGIITSGQTFTSKEVKTFTLDVEVSDSGIMRTFKDRSSIKITVYPAKLKPGFTNSTYDVIIPENQPARPVLDVSIQNIQVHYEIVSRNDSSLPSCANKFEIDFLTGIISSKVSLDAEVLKICQFYVHAWDDISFSNYSKVIVHVKDENDNAPIFLNTSHTGSVDEGSGRGSEILDHLNKPLIIKATDGDSGENSRVVYSIVEASAKSRFEIGSDTGKITTRQVLDREKRDKFTFHVRATDSGSPKLFTFAQVHIIVNDINDRIPEFTQQIYRVQLYTPIFNNTEVVTVHANDGDSNVFSSVRYSLLNHTKLFKVLPKSGTIWTKNARLITKRLYSLQVAASDGIFTSTCQVVVNLSPIRADRFKFSKPIFQTSLVENNNASRLLIILNVVGYAIGECVQFSLITPMEDFTINSNTGEIRTHAGASFDREKKSYYELVVQARLKRDPSQVAQGIVNVTVTDMNDNRPLFIGAPYYQSVHIDMAAGSPLLQVHAEDADNGSNAVIRYQITGGSLGKFSIDELSGVIKVKEKFIKGKTPGKFNLEITAHDMGTPRLKSVTIVEVPVVNEDMPVFDQNYRFSVPENALVSTVIGKIVAQGPQGRIVYYSISEGDEYNQFSLDFNTGELSTLDTFDTVLVSVYNLTVQATDSKSGSWSTTGCSIKILDVNNHRPMFHQPSYTANVYENATVGADVFTGEVVDKDIGENARITYSLIPDNEEKPLFAIDQATGMVTVVGPLDHEKQRLFHLRVRAVDHGLPPMSSSTFLKINVLDVNDNPPVFDQNEYRFIVGDYTGPGQFVGKVACVDPDHVSRAKIRYTLSDSKLVSVGAFTGILTLNEGPNRDKAIQFQVHCSDERFQSSAGVSLTTEEVNEHKPTFLLKEFTTNVQENFAPSFITVVTATDLDYGSFGIVTYSIDSSSLSEMFEINPTTGSIFSKVSLDREAMKGKIILPIRASDIGGRFDICKLTIDVIDVNDNDPVFEFPSYEATVSTATHIGTTVLTVRAIDKDSGKNGEVTYSISGLDDGAPLKINRDTGVLKLTGTPQGKAYQFIIKALDNGYPGRESSASIRINVVPAAKTMLEFSRSSFMIRIAESIPAGYRVADVTVKSSSRSTVYDFVQGNLPSSNASDVFTLDSRSGTIHLSGSLDIESVPKYNLMVKATDTKNAAAAAFMLVQIIVQNINDNKPVFDSKVYTVRIPENIAINSKILQVSATDADESETQLRYRIVTSAVTDDVLSMFTLSQKTGVLKTSAALDAESKSSYEIEVKVTDGRNSDAGPLQDTAKVRITVLDTNDSPPVFVEGPRSFSVREDYVIGEKVCTVVAQDADKNPTIRYYIVKGNELSRFSIGEKSGEIKLVRSLDREMTPRYALSVVAYDGVFVNKVNIEVIVTDSNDNAPICSKAFYRVQMLEDTQTSPIIARIEAVDPDSDDELIYTLQGDGVNKFLVNKGTGELMPGSAIDREKHASCEFSVSVTDKGGRSCYSDVYVEILDKNDNKPTFLQSKYVVPIRENASLSSMLTRVQAIDADKGQNRKVSYRLYGSEMFSIQAKTGIIVLEKPLKKDVKENHLLTVEAFDDGNPALASSASVNIIVLAESDRPPEFSKTLYVFSVSEGLAIGSILGKVETVQKAEPSQGSVDYELITGDQSTFSVDRKTGELSLKKELDHETAKRIALSIRGRYTKMPSLTSVVQVDIHVTDENDNPPEFTMKVYKASVDENVRAGSVLQVFAEDADEGDNGRVSYRLVKSAENVPFKVNKQTGVVSVAGTRPIDREEKDHYVFKIRAFDAGTPSQFNDVLVNITVADLNDNPPEINPVNTTVIVTEGRSRGYVLFSWTATDRDTVRNGPPFTYTIIEGDKNKFNVVDKSDVEGSLVAGEYLSRSKKSNRYDLVVRVTDNGSPPKSSLCYLTVHVVPPSDEKPEIMEPTMFFKVVKKSPQMVTIGRVRVTNEGKYLHQFQITDGNDDKTFSIESTSGAIKGNVRQGIYTISVQVFDGRYTASTTVTIIVNRITEDLYQNSVVVTALDITADDFVNYKIKKFANYIRLVTSAKIENIIIWAVQTKDTKRKSRSVGSRTDTNIAFAVRRTDEGGFIEPSVLQTSLKLSKETLEKKLGVSFLITVTDPCAASPCAANRKCAAVVKPLPGASPSTSDLSTKFIRDYACLCLDGSQGQDCSGITACTSNPCKQGEKCIPIGTNYECEKDINDGAIQLDGKDYVSYVLRESFDSMFKSISVSFRTEASEGYLFYAKGHDYCFLEIYEGKVRFKFDFGTGQGIVRIDDIQVNDGRWHNAQVIRNANRATLILDGGKYKAEGRAKGENVKINLDGDKVFFGAGVISQGSVENGFKGCLRHPKMNGQLLPWNGNNSLVSNGRSYGVKRSCKDSGACKKTKCPLFSDCIDTLSSYRCQCMPGHSGTFCKPTVTCADNPCRNGGTCTYFKANGKIEYRCTCRHPYTGAQCQTNSGLCASNPCRNGGKCQNIGEGTDYRCLCPARYHGPNCELDSDPCASSPCFHGARCTKVQYDFKCDCPSGASGKRCGYGSYCNRNSCTKHGKCQETLDGPSCKCKKGYQGTYCQFDVNECLSKTSPCGDWGTCINTIGSFFCNCTNGKDSPNCELPVAGRQKSESFNFMQLVYYIGIPLFVLIIVVIVAYKLWRRSHREYAQPREPGGPDIKYPLNCIELDQFPPQVAPRFVEGPPDYYTGGSADFETTALYDPSQTALSPQSTISDDDRCLKVPGSSVELSRKLLSTFKEGSPCSSPSGSANALDAKGSASDVSETEDRLNGPYHWDYTEVPEDVVNRSKPTRTRSKEGSRMGLSYNYGYEDTPRLPEKQPEKLGHQGRHNSVNLNQNEVEKPEIPERPANLRLSWQSLPKTEAGSPLAARVKRKIEAKPERSPTIQRSAAARGSESSLLEPYECMNTHLSIKDFNNRYSLALEDNSSLYLQDLLGGEYPAPPSETCPSDIESCTRPSLSVAFSDIDDMPYARQRRMLPSEISCLDADNLTETSYNSDDDNDDYNERDPLDPDQTRKLEREIKILFKEIKSKTEADVDDE